MENKMFKKISTYDAIECQSKLEFLLKTNKVLLRLYDILDIDADKFELSIIKTDKIHKGIKIKTNNTKYLDIFMPISYNFEEEYIEVMMVDYFSNIYSKTVIDEESQTYRFLKYVIPFEIHKNHTNKNNVMSILAMTQILSVIYEEAYNLKFIDSERFKTNIKNSFQVEMLSEIIKNPYDLNKNKLDLLRKYSNELYKTISFGIKNDLMKYNIYEKCNITKEDLLLC